MEFIEGNTLGNLLYKDVKNVKKYIEISVKEQIKIHSINNIEIETMEDKFLRQINNARRLDVLKKNKLLKRLEEIKWSHNLCHGDFHVFNIIMNNNSPIIIDWVDSSIGNVGADVYRSYILYLSVSQELADLYLDLYCNYSQMTQEEVFIWAPIVAGARLAENISNEESERLLSIIDTNI